MKFGITVLAPRFETRGRCYSMMAALLNRLLSHRCYHSLPRSCFVIEVHWLEVVVAAGCS